MASKRRGKQTGSGGPVVRFSDQHLWVRADGNNAVIGISDTGQKLLGEIQAIELPEVGDTVEQGESFGEVESSVTVQELVAPVSGKVIAVNDELEENPSLANDDPSGEGWLIEVALDDERELQKLMSPEEYEEWAAEQGEED